MDALKRAVLKAGAFLIVLFAADAAMGSTLGVMAMPSIGVVAGLLAGLAIFLFGIDTMADNMRRTAGASMRGFLRTMTRNRFSAMIGGAVITILMQSSSATTVLLVSFSQAHLLTAAQSVGVIIGSNIGTTFTAQLIAFKITDYALLIVATGYLASITTHRQVVRQLGMALVGLGFIFFGMYLMSASMAPLRGQPWFREIIVSFTNPAYGVAAGAILTAVIQSSAAFTGIVIALAQEGLLSLDAAIPLILGANIGTCATAALASLTASREAKRVAAVHILFNVGGVVIFLFLLPQLSLLVRIASPYEGGLAEVLPRQVANAHTIFNVLASLMFLPAAPFLATLAERIIPVTKDEFKDIGKPRYLDWDLMHTPALALERVRLEMIYIGELVESMIENTRVGFSKNDPAMVMKVVRTDDKVDALIEQTNAYLSEALRKDLSEDLVSEAYMLLNTLSELDHIADLLETNMSRLVNRKIEDNIWLSDEGMEEIKSFFDALLEAFQAVVKFIAHPDHTVLPELQETSRELYRIDSHSRKVHFDRLKAGVEESVASHQLHMDILDQLGIVHNYIDAMIKHERRLLRNDPAGLGMTA
ncbi:MAG: Na/Pi cotransporter family protein [Desulfatibacillaceae bacterium]